MLRSKYVLALTLVLLASPAWAVITDDFNRASLGANWSAAAGTIWTIPSSAAVRSVSQYAFTGIMRTEASFPDDQYAQAKVQWVNAGDPGYGGVGARMSAGNGYFATITDTEIQLRKYVASSHTLLDAISHTHTVATYYTVKITITGNLIDVDVDGVNYINDFADSSLASGAPGLMDVTGPSTAGLPLHDDFESTDASGGGGAASPKRALMGVGQ
jgi:hypothetical protein